MFFSPRLSASPTANTPLQTPRDEAGQAQAALDKAVRDDDRELAHALLSKGANPERTSIIAASAEMKTLLTAWHRTNLIYAHHTEQDKQAWTILDQALVEGDHVQARKVLQRIQGKRSVTQAWEESLNNGQHDFLRALLIVGTPEEWGELTREKSRIGEWKTTLCEDPLLRDPGLAAAIAEFPYQSGKRDKENFNGEVKFTNSTQFIWCRHLATQLQEEQARHPSGKFDYSKYAVPENIAKHVNLDIEKKYKELKAQASETHLIDNARFGQFLASQFADMEQKNDLNKQMLIHSPDHTMNLALKIKEGGQGGKSYVVNFFDPNTTTTHTRSKASSLQTLEMQTLEDYLVEGQEDLHFYYPEAQDGGKQGLSMIHVRPTEEQAGITNPGDSSAGRTLTTCVDLNDEDTAAAVIWNLMTHGFSGNLRQLDSHLTTLTEDQRVKLLSAKSAEGTPALYRCMQEGQADAIKAYGALLTSISMPKRFDLLAGKNAQGTPALYIAMQAGKADAIKAYGELLTSIPMAQCIELLAGKEDIEGIPALFIGMQAGDVDAIKAYGELLRRVPVKDRIALLIGKSNVGIPALHTGVHSGNTEALKAYGALLKDLGLPADQQVDLLLARDDSEEKSSALHVALYAGKFRTGTRLLELLEALVPDLSADKRAALRDGLKEYEDLIAQAGSHGGHASTVLSLQEWSKMSHAFSRLKTALAEGPMASGAATT